jgi:hypothetical protein
LLRLHAKYSRADLAVYAFQGRSVVYSYEPICASKVSVQVHKIHKVAVKRKSITFLLAFFLFLKAPPVFL